MLSRRFCHLLRISTVQINDASILRKFGTKANIVRSPYPDIILPDSLLHRFVFKNIHKWPKHTAIECGISGKRYTYSELFRNCKKFATSLKKLGLKQGDTIAVMLPNIPEFPVAYLGGLEAGVVVTTVNPSYTKEEVINQLKDCNANVIVCHPLQLSDVLETTKHVKNLRIICTHNIDGSTPKTDNNFILFEELINDSVEISDFNNDTSVSDTAVIFYSSGTTGLPKGTCLTHKSITGNITQIGAEPVKKAIQTHGDYQDITIALLPFFHCYGNVILLLASLSEGVKIITLPKFDPKHFLRCLESYKNIMLYLVPPLIFFLGNSPDVTEKHLKNVREIMNGAAPCSPHDLAKIREKNEKLILSQGYGMTEASPVLTMHSPRGNYKDNMATIGQLVPNTFAKIKDLENGEALPQNQIGEMVFKGPQIMKGYLNNAKATAETVDPDGWLHTGDVGYYDENGYFFITDRIKELIKVKGFQVAPAELEEVLRKHPAILEAGVVGVPDEKKGEIPVAFVQTSPGSNVTEDEIKEFLASQLSKHKHLGWVKFLPVIPTTPSGKILRKDLRAMVKNTKK